jgi:hypothetical protein
MVEQGIFSQSFQKYEGYAVLILEDPFLNNAKSSDSLSRLIAWEERM